MRNIKNEKILMSGNEACGEGAIRSGCKFYAGYPITPQNELTAYMSWRIEEKGGSFIQAESELAAINMVMGASVGGARAMTSSSSPGVSLKQEGISYLAGCALPAVIVNIMRGGPGLGNIGPGQADYFQATKGGGHGDYRLTVLAPATCQEMLEFTYLAFDIADKYRNPVMILGDGILGQMMEPVEVNRVRQKTFDELPKKNWALTGCKGRKPQSIKSLLLKDGALEEWNKTLQAKFRMIEKKEVKCEEYKTKDAKVIVVAYGTTSRIARASVDELRKKNIKVGLIRPITLWPFPHKAIRRHADKKVKFVVVEMSAGQMVEDVRLAVQDDKRVSFYGRMGGGVPTKEEVTKSILKAKNKK